VHFDATLTFLGEIIIILVQLALMILGLFFLRQKKSKYSVPSKVGGGGLCGSLVYIVYLMSGGTSLATQVGGTTLILQAFARTDGRDFSGLPLDQKIKKSAVRVGGPISYRGVRDRREEKKPPSSVRLFWPIREATLANGPPGKETLPDYSYKRESP
jgi:hypothetical protein